MKRTSSYFPKYSAFLLTLLFVLVAFVYGYHNTIDNKPSSIHQWRQADCWSYAVNYYHEGMQFFKPTLHYINESETGHVVAELPLTYYIAAGLWVLFGQHAWLFRGLNIVIVFAGLLAFFKLAERLLKHSFWAAILTLLLFTSPILVFYTNNFLTDAPAFGLSLLGFYCFYIFYESGRLKPLYLANIFFMLAIMLKTSAGILFAGICAIFIMEVFFKISIKPNTRLFTNPKQQFIPFVITLFVVLAWYMYASWFNEKHDGPYFLLSILPIWHMDYASINQISRSLNENLIYQFFNVYTFVMVLGMFFWLLINWEKAPRFLTYIMVFTALQCIIFLLLFFRVFDVHDYYLLNLLVFMAVVPLAFFRYLKENHPKRLNNKRIQLFFLIVLLFNVYYAAQKNSIKYHAKQEAWHYSFLNRNNELEYWRWFHWYYDSYLKAYDSVTPYLRSLGIGRNDRVISLKDPSPNVSLALMDVKGVTNFYRRYESPDDIQFEIDRGASYLIINKEQLLNEDYLKPFLNYKMGQYKQIEIFDLRPFKK